MGYKWHANLNSDTAFALAQLKDRQRVKSTGTFSWKIVLNRTSYSKLTAEGGERVFAMSQGQYHDMPAMFQLSHLSCLKKAAPTAAPLWRPPRQQSRPEGRLGRTRKRHKMHKREEPARFIVSSGAQGVERSSFSNHGQTRVSATGLPAGQWRFWNTYISETIHPSSARCSLSGRPIQYKNADFLVTYTSW